MTRILVLLVGFSVAVVTRPVVAHHSETAEYDSTKPVKVTGTISKVEWLNPHVWYRITIDDAKIFTRPFSQDFELTPRPDWESLGPLEYVCEENNRCAGGNCRPSGTP